jgi:hypothetical protein
MKGLLILCVVLLISCKNEVSIRPHFSFSLTKYQLLSDEEAEIIPRIKPLQSPGNVMPFVPNIIHFVDLKY